MENNFQDVKDNLSKSLYGMSLTEAHKQGICIKCKTPALERCYSDAGRREYDISGLCELCFDEEFPE